MPNKPFVYVASPYTKGDPAINVHFQCEIFNNMIDEGSCIPYLPLWSHFQHLVFPRPYEDWIAYDNAWIEGHKFDACLRLNASCEMPNGTIYEEMKSSGADNEVALFEKLGLPVFYNFVDLYAWANDKEAQLRRKLEKANPFRSPHPTKVIP